MKYSVRIILMLIFSGCTFPSIAQSASTVEGLTPDFFFKDERSFDLYKQANYLLNLTTEYAPATSLARQSLSTNPKNPFPYMLISDSKLYTGRMDDALENLKMACDLAFRLDTFSRSTLKTVLIEKMVALCVLKKDFDGAIRFLRKEKRRHIDTLMVSELINEVTVLKKIAAYTPVQLQQQVLTGSETNNYHHIYLYALGLKNSATGNYFNAHMLYALSAYYNNARPSVERHSTRLLSTLMLPEYAGRRFQAKNGGFHPAPAHDFDDAFMELVRYSDGSTKISLPVFRSSFDKFSAWSQKNPDDFYARYLKSLVNLIQREDGLPDFMAGLLNGILGHEQGVKSRELIFEAMNSSGK